ncbi:MAG: hypothetical protein ACLS63_09375 [Flavonifractor plautii]
MMGSNRSGPSATKWSSGRSCSTREAETVRRIYDRPGRDSYSALVDSLGSGASPTTGTSPGTTAPSSGDRRTPARTAFHKSSQGAILHGAGRRQDNCKKSPAQKELRKLCGGSPPAWVERQVLGLLNRLIQHPERITCPVLEDEPPPEVKKLRRGLDELLHRPPVDEVQTRDLAFRLADLQLNAIGPEEYETLRLRRLFQGWAPMAELEQELLHQSVRRIAVSNGTVTVLLKNNQTLEGGHYT